MASAAKPNKRRREGRERREGEEVRWRKSGGGSGEGEEAGSSSKLRRALIKVSRSSSSLHSFPGSLLLAKLHQRRLVIADLGYFSNQS